MRAPSTWLFPPAILNLQNDEVHLWRAFLDRPPAYVPPGEPGLSSNELARASRFVFARDRDRSIAARRVLREIIAKYLGRGPTQIDFIYGPQGKPALLLSNSDPAIRFNVSHSGGLAVYAVSLGRELGVDIELIRDGITATEIVERFFSCREISEFRSLPADKQNEGFFLCWTRKEAYLKALGVGLSIPLDSFAVSLTPGAPAQLRSDDSSHWTLSPFQPQKGHAGAVVVAGKAFELKLWHYEASPSHGGSVF